MARSDELAKAVIDHLGLKGKGVQGIVIKMEPGKKTSVIVSLVARDELETFIGSELKLYELKALEC